MKLVFTSVSASVSRSTLKTPACPVKFFHKPIFLPIAPNGRGVAINFIIVDKHTAAVELCGYKISKVIYLVCACQYSSLGLTYMYISETPNTAVLGAIRMNHCKQNGFVETKDFVKIRNRVNLLFNIFLGKIPIDQMP